MNSAENMILAFILGLIIGSFLNVCIERLPKEKSVWWPLSKCPKCDKTISWLDKVPIISFLLLKGKCRNCKQVISIQYPAVELLTGVMSLGFFLIYGWSVFFGVVLAFGSLLMIASVVDLKLGIIPDEISFWGILMAWIASFCFPPLQGEHDARLALANSVLGMLAGAFLLYSSAMLGELVFKKECMGGGDLKLIAMIGAFVGWKKALLAFILSPILSVPVALLTRFVYKRETIAFGPYLAFGGLIAFVMGDMIIHSILG